MRLIDADKLHREKIDDIICYSVQQIANAPTVCDIDAIRQEIVQERDKVYQNRHGHDTYYADGLDTALEIIDEYTKGDADV